jgi:hypothetical protein
LVSLGRTPSGFMSETVSGVAPQKRVIVMAIAYDRGPGPRPSVQRVSGPESRAGLLDIVLDRGVVLDAWGRVPLFGIEAVTIDGRVVVASVETSVRYAEAIGITAPAAAPHAHQVMDGRQGGHDPARSRRTSTRRAGT